MRVRSRGHGRTRWGKPQIGDVKILMMDREGRRRWRQDQLFKLRAKPLDFEKRKFYK
jgi:hypothetical protein